MNSKNEPFRRSANPLAMVFRQSFIHSLYVIPAWYILRDFSRESASGMLGTLFSVFILLMVFQIRLRKRLNGKTEDIVNRSVESSKTAGRPSGTDTPQAGEQSAGDNTCPIRVKQSFSFPDYRRLNVEVVFSYLRPWLTLISGIVFVAAGAAALYLGADIIRTGLAFMLSLYFLALPWLLFVRRTGQAYRKGRDSMDGQVILIERGSIEVRVGSSSREITALSDIAVTRRYLLLFVAGSNYVQVRRDALSNGIEAEVLSRVRKMVTPA